MTEIIVPELGEDIKTATVVCWNANVGEQVSTEDDIVELVTDKATFNVPAPANGTLKEIRFEKGQEAPIGSVLGVIE